MKVKLQWWMVAGVVGMGVLAQQVWTDQRKDQLYQSIARHDVQISTVLTHPIVLDGDTLLSLTQARTLTTKRDAIACQMVSTCFEAVFLKNGRFFQVDFEIQTPTELLPLSAQELNQEDLKVDLLQHAPNLYAELFGRPDVL